MDFLVNICVEEVQHILLTCETARSMRQSLTDQYLQDIVENRQAPTRFLTYKFKPEHSVRAHIQPVKLLAQQLKDFSDQTDDMEIWTK